MTNDYAIGGLSDFVLDQEENKFAELEKEIEYLKDQIDAYQESLADAEEKNKELTEKLNAYGEAAYHVNWLFKHFQNAGEL